MVLEKRVQEGVSIVLSTTCHMLNCSIHLNSHVGKHSGIIVSMLIHTYPHRPLRKIKVTICWEPNRLTAHFMCGLMSDLVICKFWKYGHTWHRMSLLRPGVIKQHKANSTQPVEFTCRCTLRGDIVSILTHIYLHKPLRKIKWPSTNVNDQAGSPLYVCPDVWSGDSQA